MEDRVSSSGDLLGYIFMCRAGRDLAAAEYLSTLCNRLVGELVATVPCAFGPAGDQSDAARVLRRACRETDLNVTVCHAIILISIIHNTRFREHLEACSRPDRVHQITQFVVQNMNSLLLGLRADEAPVTDKTCVRDLAFPTFEHFVWEVRFRYFCNWDPRGDFRKSCGVVAPTHDPRICPDLAAVANAPERDRTSPALAFRPPRWSEVEADGAGR